MILKSYSADLIVKNLYLSGAEFAENLIKLKEYNISTILTVGVELKINFSNVI
jgi:hypothetical protein